MFEFFNTKSWVVASLFVVSVLAIPFLTTQEKQDPLEQIKAWKKVRQETSLFSVKLGPADLATFGEILTRLEVKKNHNARVGDLEYQSIDNLGGLVVLLKEVESQRGRRIAEQLRENVVQIASSKLGASHPQTFYLMYPLGESCNEFENGKRLKYVQAYFDRAKEQLGLDHVVTLGAYTSLADTLRRMGQTSRCLEVHKEYLSATKQALGKRHWMIPNVYGNIAEACLHVGELGESLIYTKKQLDLATSLSGHELPVTVLDQLQKEIRLANSRTNKLQDLKEYANSPGPKPNTYIWNFERQIRGQVKNRRKGGYVPITGADLYKMREFSKRRRTASFYAVLSIAEYRVGNLKIAVETANKSIEIEKNGESSVLCLAILAKCYSVLGNQQKVQQTIAEFQKLHPEKSKEFKLPVDIESLLQNSLKRSASAHTKKISKNRRLEDCLASDGIGIS